MLFGIPVSLEIWVKNYRCMDTLEDNSKLSMMQRNHIKFYLYGPNSQICHKGYKKAHLVPVCLVCLS